MEEIVRCSGSTTKTPLLANSAPFLLIFTDNKIVVLLRLSDNEQNNLKVVIFRNNRRSAFGHELPFACGRVTSALGGVAPGKPGRRYVIGPGS